jgi:hypothetical protein
VNVYPWIIPQGDKFLLGSMTAKPSFIPPKDKFRMGSCAAQLSFIPPGDKFRMGSCAAQLSFIMSDTDRLCNRFNSVNRGEPSGRGFRKFALIQDGVFNPYARKGNRFFVERTGFSGTQYFLTRNHVIL